MVEISENMQADYTVGNDFTSTRTDAGDAGARRGAEGSAARLAEAARGNGRGRSAAL